MIGNEENQEEVTFKVADRRKFNPDGSVREGVTIEPDPEPEPESSTDDGSAPLPDDIDLNQITLDDEADQAEASLPGADDPASFVNFLSMLATNAATALGAVPNPATGKRVLDLDTGKYWLDVIGMVKEKTKGNLHQEEQRLLDGLLGDLRMQYVHLVKATEEKLKAQAAAKFSGDELLGKR